MVWDKVYHDNPTVQQYSFTPLWRSNYDSLNSQNKKLSDYATAFNAEITPARAGHLLGVDLFDLLRNPDFQQGNNPGAPPEDGLHPARQGHEKIADELLDKMGVVLPGDEMTFNSDDERLTYTPDAAFGTAVNRLAYPNPSPGYDGKSAGMTGPQSKVGYTVPEGGQPIIANRIRVTMGGMADSHHNLQFKMGSQVVGTMDTYSLTTNLEMRKAAANGSTDWIFSFPWPSIHPGCLPAATTQTAMCTTRKPASTPSSHRWLLRCRLPMTTRPEAAEKATQREGLITRYWVLAGV